jgi:hypothetical protein
LLECATRRSLGGDVLRSRLARVYGSNHCPRDADNQ